MTGLTITAADVATTSTSGQSGQSIIAGAPTALSFQQVADTGTGNLSVQLSGVWSGTVQFEESPDGGTTFYPCDMNVQGIDTIIQSATGNGVFVGNMAAGSIFRARASALASGTVNVSFLGTVVTDLVHAVIVNPINPAPIVEKKVIVQTNPTVTASAYSANNVVGGIQTLMAAMRAANDYGVLDSVSVLDASAQAAQLSIFFFKALPTGGTYADKGALVLSAADLPNFLGKIDLLAASYDPIGSAVKGISLNSIGMDVKGDASGNIYAIATTTGTPTYTLLCLTFNYGFKQA